MKFTERLKGYARMAAGCLRNERGQTSLTEAAVAIAVGLTLAASLAPMVISIGDDAKVTRAKADTVGISKAIQSMFGDTKEFPVRETAKFKVSVPITASETAVTHLRSGGVGDVSRNPTINISGTLFANGITRTEDPEGGANLLNSHITFDSEGACVGNTTSKCSLKYRTGGTATGEASATNWKGPYMQGEVNQDPWGRNYIVLTTGAIVPPANANDGRTAVAAGTTVAGLKNSSTQIFAWVLSAGPNGKLETSEVDSSASGDDVGVVFSVLSVPEASAKKSN